VSWGRLAPAEALRPLGRWNGGSTRRRLSYLVIAAELKGNAEGRRLLDALPSPDDDQGAAVAGILRRAYGPEGFREPTAADERAVLGYLGWFGVVALAPGISRERGGPLVIAAWPGAPAPWPRVWTWSNRILDALGGVLLAIFLARMLVRGIPRRVRPGRALARSVFAEATALWIVLALAQYLWGNEAWGSQIGRPGMFLMRFAVVAVPLAWPLFRGLDGRRSQVAAGLTRGAGWGREVLLGLLAYPVVRACQALLGYVLPRGTTHPHFADAMLTSGDSMLVFEALAGALVAAPLLEEIEFRGLVYRFLRDSTSGLPESAGVAASVLLSAFLFAVCHPQGWSSVPALMAFAAGAALLREWRGSLVAPVVLHLAGWVHILAGLAIHGAP
jgi:membrane protease YdiL (CAAX protease family)